MTVRELTVGRIQRDERPAVIGALTRAFYNDPLFEFFLPNQVHQTKGALAFMAAALADAEPFGDVWVARAGGEVASAAVWLPPAGYPRSRKRDLMTVVRGFPAFIHSGVRAFASVRLLNEVDKVHHEVGTPHYYLAVLGTDPLFRRIGAASAALQPVLERCDEEGLPAYLETQREENLAFYARHGFELQRKLDIRGVPPLWTMLRNPRSG